MPNRMIKPLMKSSRMIRWINRNTNPGIKRYNPGLFSRKISLMLIGLKLEGEFSDILVYRWFLIQTKITVKLRMQLPDTKIFHLFYISPPFNPLNASY